MFQPKNVHQIISKFTFHSTKKTGIQRNVWMFSLHSNAFHDFPLFFNSIQTVLWLLFFQFLFLAPKCSYSAITYSESEPITDSSTNEYSVYTSGFTKYLPRFNSACICSPLLTTYRGGFSLYMVIRAGHLSDLVAIKLQRHKIRLLFSLIIR